MREPNQRKKTFFPSVRAANTGDGGAFGTQVGVSGTDISTTPSDDVDMLEGQDQEPVSGWGTRGILDYVTMTS